MAEGTWSVGFGDFSSRSELCRLTVGGSGRKPKPKALDELGIRFPFIGSNPTSISLPLARSRSPRRRSLSALRAVDWDRCFSINFHSCPF